MTTYKALTPETLPQQLASIEPIATKLGGDASSWHTKEVGDGNLNLVFIVTGSKDTLVVKQALPYVRLVGESWPLPLKRSFFEYHALTRQQAYDPGSVPEVFYFNEEQAIIAMEFLSPHVILRQSFIEGVQHANLAQTIGQFAARTAFRGSDLSLQTSARKADVALFSDNVELCDITESLVFTEPYFNAEQNRHTTPQLDALVAELRNDTNLLVEAQHLKASFCNNAETLMHGDLHAGSIMVHEDSARIIDPEFAAYGPMGFDVGMCIGNLLMAYFAQSGHESTPGERDEYREWILSLCGQTWQTFQQEFSTLFRSERTGILYPASVLQAAENPDLVEQALAHRLMHIWQDLLGFAGVEMHRRILGLAHIIELDNIPDDNRRASCESRALKLGRYLVVNRRHLMDMGSVTSMARLLQQSNVL